jgi:cullin 1
VNHVFRYLNRHWVKRELDEGKKAVYDVYTSHLVLWHNKLFKEISDLLIDAVSQLVEEHKKGNVIEFGPSKDLIEYIVSLGLGLDGTDLSVPIRDLYGNVFETPLRIAIESQDYQDYRSPSMFLYETPVTNFMLLSGRTRMDIEERLSNLILNSGFKKPLTDDSDYPPGTVNLVPTSLNVIKVGK